MKYALRNREKRTPGFVLFLLFAMMYASFCPREYLCERGVLPAAVRLGGEARPRNCESQMRQPAVQDWRGGKKQLVLISFLT